MPETGYARSGELHIAYQTSGEGPPDLLLLADGLIPMEAMAEEARFARFLDRLAAFARLIRFDRRGIGLSDPVSPNAPLTLEQWMEDARAVMAAARSEHPATIGIAEGTFVATLLAATHPDAVSALVLLNATPAIAAEPFAGWGVASRGIRRLEETVEEAWGTDTSAIVAFAPSAANDAAYHEWLARSLRRATSPAAARAVFDVLFYSDVRNVLPAIRVPTLVIHRAGNRWLTPEHGRYLADHIPGARYVEVPGEDHVPYLGDPEPILEEIEEFLTGARRAHDTDRVLATVLFTDIVGATERAAAMGDRAWRERLDRHDAAVRRQLERHRGREVKTTGDGFVATFDGPARAIRCAQAIRDAARQAGVEVRAGLHTGECEVRGEDIAGIAVHIAARVASAAGAGEVLVSRTVVDLVAGSGIEFETRGEHALKGVPGEWRLFALRD